MLKSLYIKDYALIEKVSVVFNEGLNIITGETGAGKSILIDAMSLLLGERASSEVIRKGADKAIVEGIFDVANNKKVKRLIEENELDLSDELIVRRELSLRGSNRCFINDSPVNLNLVKEIGNLLVDLHGQHEHQSLLRTETHIEFLDEYGLSENILADYRNEFKKLNSLLSDLKNLQEKEIFLKEKRDLYSFQLKEIDSISPEENEDEIINNELKILENAERIVELTNGIYDQLYDSDSSVFTSLGRVQHDLIELSRLDTFFEQTLSELESAVTISKEIASAIYNYKSKFSIDPEKLEEMRLRLASINRLKKKYGGTINLVLEYRKKIKEDLDLAENYENQIAGINEKILAQRKLCGNLAEHISVKRKEIAKQIAKEIKEILKTLGIQNPAFEIKIKNAESHNENYVIVNDKKICASVNGIDEVEFYISTNIGEDVKPLAKVASGGEISRIMLALKSSLAKNDKLPVLIFDEIDVGVSGRIAQKVGQTLNSLARFHQVITITHLPQIAAFGKSHYLVEKIGVDGRVSSSIKKLDDEEKIKEVAKLMSGEQITDTSLQGAKELIKQSA